MRPLNGVAKDDSIKNPSIDKFYDFTKSGTEIVDQLNYYYTIRYHSNRWDLHAFYYILDTNLNSKALYFIKKSLEIKKTELN